MLSLQGRLKDGIRVGRLGQEHQDNNALGSCKTAVSAFSRFKRFLASPLWGATTPPDPPGPPEEGAQETA
eukprot:7804612-Alexandrium_andersonii.AAC.1